MNLKIKIKKRLTSNALTEPRVVERKIPQVRGVLGQGKEASRVAVPHQAAPGRMLQDSVLDDLWMKDSTAQV